MVAVTNLLSKYTILYGKVMTLVVTIQSVARRWTTRYNVKFHSLLVLQANLQPMIWPIANSYVAENTKVIQ